jgi:hypothetical protein
MDILEKRAKCRFNVSKNIIGLKSGAMGKACTRMLFNFTEIDTRRVF